MRSIGVRTARDEAVAQATQANALRQALDLATLRYRGRALDLSRPARRAAKLVRRRARDEPGALGELTAAVQLYKALGGGWRH